MPAYCDCFFSEILALWWVLLVSPSPTTILISVLGVIDAPVPSPSLGMCWTPQFPLLPCEYTISLRSLLLSPVWIRPFPCVSHLLQTWSDSSKYFKSFCSSVGHWPYSQGQLRLFGSPRSAMGLQVYSPGRGWVAQLTSALLYRVYFRASLTTNSRWILGDFFSL